MTPNTQVTEVKMDKWDCGGKAGRAKGDNEG
jgi:hypothetical protein